MTATSLRLLLIVFLLSTALTGTVFAADPSETGPAEAPPPPPMDDQTQPGSEELVEPEVTIIRREDRTIEEYRVNGELRYAKITPSHGPAYYMIDTDGDGVLDRRHDNIDNPPINQWILMRW
jgi:hypothetical protein